eukprot:7109088-Pyramimonas_sp.AAC.1
MDSTLDYLRFQLGRRAQGCPPAFAGSSPCPDFRDTQYLLYAVARQYRFLVVPGYDVEAAGLVHYGGPREDWYDPVSVQVQIFDHDGSPAAPDQVEVGVEFKFDDPRNQEMELIRGANGTGITRIGTTGTVGVMAPMGDG